MLFSVRRGPNHFHENCRTERLRVCALFGPDLPDLLNVMSAPNKNVGSLRRLGYRHLRQLRHSNRVTLTNEPNYLTIERVAVKIARLPHLASAVPLCMS